MPRYYFHVRDSSSRELDDTGIEFESLDDAIDDARRARGEMLADAALEGVADSTRVFEIAVVSGRVLATVPFLDS
jgi:hypothetical protein